MSGNEMICPRCQGKRLKDWNELTSDEKFVAERLPASGEFAAGERQLHSFCTLCWYETRKRSEKA